MNIVLTMMTMLYNILLTVSILGILSILGFIGVKKIQKFEQNASDVDIFRSEESKTKARVRSSVPVTVGSFALEGGNSISKKVWPFFKPLTADSLDNRST